MADTTTILNNGDSAQRVDIIFVAEGYQVSERAKFLADAGVMLNYFTSISSNISPLNSPFSNYAKYLNASALFVASNQSGVDMPNKSVSVDTAFGASQYGSDGRLVYGDQSKVLSTVGQAYAANAQEIVIVLVNSPTYGGAGGRVSWATTGDIQSTEVALHEIGHSFAGLQDEYADSALTSSYPLSGLKSVHLSTSPTNLPWSAWLGFTDSLGVVGAYEGGYYRSTGVWRATQDSKMFHLGQPFSAPQKEAIVATFYARIGDYLSLQIAIPGIFKAVVPDSSKLSFSWSVGSQIVSGQYANYLDVYGTASYRADIPVGITTVDASGMLRTLVDSSKQSEISKVTTVPVVELSGANLSVNQSGAVFRCGPQDSTLTLTASANGNYIDGGAGIDTLQIAALSSDFTIYSLPSGASVVQRAGQDWMALLNIENIKFIDKTIVLKTTGATTLVNLPGSDVLTGGASSIDTAIYSTPLSSYTINQSVANGATVYTVRDKAGVDGIDTLASVERLSFSNVKVALDLAPTQSAGQTALLMGAVLPGRLYADPSKQGLLGSVIGLFDQGFTLQQLSGALMRLPIWDVLTGKANPTSTDIASYLLSNVNEAAPNAVTLQSAVAALSSQTGASQGDFLAQLAASEANQAHVGLVGLAATGLLFG